MSPRAEGSREQLLLTLLLLLILVAFLLVLLTTGNNVEASWSPNEGVGEVAPDGSLRPNRPAPGEVVEALLGRRDLIPYEGTLGGTMGFYSRDNIEVLNDRWVFARFEDGHRMGSMILEYRRTTGGDIAFRVIEAALH